MIYVWFDPVEAFSFYVLFDPLEAFFSSFDARLLLLDKTSHFLLKFEEVLRSGMVLRGLESIPDIMRHEFTLLDVTFAPMVF